MAVDSWRHLCYLGQLEFYESKPKSGAKKPVAAFGQKEEDKTADSTQSQEVCKFDTYILLIVQNPELKQKSFFEGSTLWIRFGN